MRTMGAGKVKIQFLGILDQVADTREPVTVTKNGRPVARILPMPAEEQDPIFGFYKGKIEVVGDIVSPAYTDEEPDEFFAATTLVHGTKLVTADEAIRASGEVPCIW